ncbi:hypothetical protein, partial [Streptomyces sp. NPDC056304]|uniref:hypothetical protein n=1 Tax=Streptomyces sp. NPDC056304 TaxID=3345778 RepID=UPI0035D76CC8
VPGVFRAVRTASRPAPGRAGDDGQRARWTTGGLLRARRTAGDDGQRATGCGPGGLPATDAVNRHGSVGA